MPQCSPAKSGLPQALSQHCAAGVTLCLRAALPLKLPSCKVTKAASMLWCRRKPIRY